MYFHLMRRVPLLRRLIAVAGPATIADSTREALLHDAVGLDRLKFVRLLLEENQRASPSVRFSCTAARALRWSNSFSPVTRCLLRP